MTVALYYHPEGYTTSAPKLMGRHAAGESFLRGFLQYSKTDRWCIQVDDPAFAKHFEASARALGRREAVQSIQKTQLADLAQPGLLHYPGPSIGKAAWERALFGHGEWSLTGITHTTSSAGAMDSIVEWITAPVQPWDAVICTSTAVKAHVRYLLQAQAEHFAQRLGAQRIVIPQLPIIPLGIHTADFAHDAAARARARQALGVDERTQVVLFMGRLSFHAKAHPLAMYQALEWAAQRCGAPVVLVECGWHANDAIRVAYEEASRQACPSVKVITLDGRKAENRTTAWAGADVFCSLSDNIQETFGITPIEAMAAGLPVVVSDWDGYRDTVRHGVDGFRIPTLMPQAALGGDLSARHALGIDNYDFYCGNTCMLVSVDVGQTAQAFMELFRSPDLRRRMGQAGQARAREIYDWSRIMPQYEALWHELQARRRRDAPSVPGALKPTATPWPARADPFSSFEAYPTQHLSPQTLLQTVDDTAQQALERALAIRSLRMVKFAQAVMPDETQLRTLLLDASSEPRPAIEWVSGETEMGRAMALRSLAWLVKMNILKVATPNPARA